MAMAFDTPVPGFGTNTARHGMVPRTVIFSGKAAPGYAMAKLIIELIRRSISAAR
jgi:glucan phosphorylase